MKTISRMLAAPFFVLAAALLFQASACVETAECNESVTCPSGEVCYDFRCRPVCERDADCDEEESCEPCKPPESVEGRCFGAELSACIQQ